MVWNQDLAKLKQQLKEEGDPAPLPAPKPVTPQPTRALGEEDATFLAAMGKPAPPSPNPVEMSPTAEAGRPAAGVHSGVEVEFQAAVGSLQGLRPMARNPVFSALQPVSPKTSVEESPAPQPPEGKPSPSAASGLEPTGQVPLAVSPTPSKEPPGPRLIHLAAGMAVEVEAVLDLRGHSVHDARERLKERLQDAGVLGWRTLHVILGPSEALRQAFLAFLLTPPARILAQYAQAPIPMGGNHAFIVYFVGPAV